MHGQYSEGKEGDSNIYSMHSRATLPHNVGEGGFRRGKHLGVEEHTAPIPQSIIWFTKAQQAESDSESLPRISLK